MISTPSVLQSVTLNNEDKVISVFTENPAEITSVTLPHLLLLTAILDPRYTGVPRTT